MNGADVKQIINDWIDVVKQVSNKTQRKLVIADLYPNSLGLDRILKISKWHHAAHIDDFCSHFVEMRELSQAYPQPIIFYGKHGF